MPGPLIQRKDISNAAISGQPRNFSKIGGKSRTARAFFYFKTENVPVSMPHALGSTPASFRVVSVSRNLSAGAPGTIYQPTHYDGAGANDKASVLYSMTRNYIVLACSTGETWAEVEVS